MEISTIIAIASNVHQIGILVSIMLGFILVALGVYCLVIETDYSGIKFYNKSFINKLVYGLIASVLLFIVTPSERFIIAQSSVLIMKSVKENGADPEIANKAIETLTKNYHQK